MTDHAQTLRSLHTAPEILVLVNAWDVASARTVAATPGCRAVATASAAIAAAHGYDDGEQTPLDLVLAVTERIATSVDLPVTADLESGYGDPEATLRRAVDAGVVGANIEDGLRPLDESVALMEAALRGATAGGVDLVLNARTDAYLLDRGWEPQRTLDEALQRGRAYLEAGAECVFVPLCTEESDVRTLAQAFDGRLSLMGGVPGLPGPEVLADWGVARVSHGPFAQAWAMEALGVRAADLLAPAGGAGANPAPTTAPLG